jgi:RecA-family ATPase
MKYIFILLLFLTGSKVFGQGELTCSGDVQIKDYEASSEVILSINEIAEGKQIELSHPITSDMTVAVPLTIQKVIKNNDSVQVIATYNDTIEPFTDLLTFRYQVDSDGTVRLLDFKGFEGDTSFGVGSLSCQ